MEACVVGFIDVLAALRLNDDVPPFLFQEPMHGRRIPVIFERGAAGRMHHDLVPLRRAGGVRELAHHEGHVVIEGAAVADWTACASGVDTAGVYQTKTARSTDMINARMWRVMLRFRNSACEALD